MTEDEAIHEWIATRRGGSPEADAALADAVMARVRVSASRPSFAERIEAAARRCFPARRPRWVYLGGSAFAGSFRVVAILYLVLGIC